MVKCLQTSGWVVLNITRMKYFVSNKEIHLNSVMYELYTYVMEKFRFKRLKLIEIFYLSIIILNLFFHSLTEVIIIEF